MVQSCLNTDTRQDVHKPLFPLNSQVTGTTQWPIGYSAKEHNTLSKLKEASKANKEMLGTTPKKTTKTKMYNNISTVTMMKYILITY